MSQPQPEQHGDRTPYTDPALYEHQTSDASHAVRPPLRAVPLPGRDDHAASRALHIVRPAPEPEKPATPKTDARIARQLTWNEIQYFIDHDPDMFFDEDLYWDIQFDRAIDREPEID